MENLYYFRLELEKWHSKKLACLILSHFSKFWCHFNFQALNVDFTKCLERYMNFPKMSKLIETLTTSTPTEFGLHLLWTSPLPMLHLNCRFETRPDLRMPTKRHWKADNIVSMKYEAMLYPNLRAELVVKMKTDRADVRVGPQIKGHPGYNQWQPPLTSLNALIVLELEPGLLSEARGERGAFFKYLKDIYTPAQSQVEVHRGAGEQLCFRPLKRHYNFNLSDWLIDTVQTWLQKQNWVNICTFVSIDVTPEVTQKGERLYADDRKQ